MSNSEITIATTKVVQCWGQIGLVLGYKASNQKDLNTYMNLVTKSQINNNKTITVELNQVQYTSVREQVRLVEQSFKLSGGNPKVMDYA